jgi:hypothetical protein
MKKFILIILAIIAFVFIGCNSETPEVIEGPAAALQGKWYRTFNDVIFDGDNHFIEFKGNTMRCYRVLSYDASTGEYDILDDSGQFTCDGKTINVFLIGNNGDGPQGYQQNHYFSYTIGEKMVGNVKYSTVLFIGNSDYWPNSQWVKSDSAKQEL